MLVLGLAALDQTWWLHRRTKGAHRRRDIVDPGN